MEECVITSSLPKYSTPLPTGPLTANRDLGFHLESSWNLEFLLASFTVSPTKKVVTTARTKATSSEELSANKHHGHGHVLAGWKCPRG